MHEHVNCRFFMKAYLLLTTGSSACTGTQNTADLHSCSNKDKLEATLVVKSL
jgi:hypothetical protein